MCKFNYAIHKSVQVHVCMPTKSYLKRKCNDETHEYEYKCLYVPTVCNIIIHLIL